MKEKIAFVCQRYGLAVNGGSEQYCRQIAEKLSSDYDVTVFTSCAEDYITWKNSYPSGIETINDVTVKRFSVKRLRNRYFSALVARALQKVYRHPKWVEWWWIDLQGPYCPDLIKALNEDYYHFKTIFFMTYLYYPTAKGMKLNLPNAVLIPTTHDEPPVYFKCYDTIFSNAKYLVWLTPEERSFAYKRFARIKEIPNIITGIGIEEHDFFDKIDDSTFPEDIAGKKYILYAGRIAESKGCKELFDFFQKYKKEHSENLKLVLIGKSAMKIPSDPDIINLGFISDKMKFVMMKKAAALVLHSRYESLSMVVLESMSMGCPVLVTGKCGVLKGHCIRSNAGLYFDNYHEYEERLNSLLSDSVLYANLSKNGIKYIQENYCWDIILHKYKQVINSFETIE